jgi:rod shape-determining protein MreB
MRTTFVAPLTAETAKEIQRKAAQQTGHEPGAKPARTDLLLVGFDFGTNTSCLMAAYAGSADLVVNETIPTVVGYAKEGIVENLLPDNAKVLFGEMAMKHRMHVRLVAPLADGVVEDLAGARDFTWHLRRLINAPQGVEVRAVIGIPATASRAERETLSQAVLGLFHKVLLIPEPFLAALGHRDESRLADPAYPDPIRNALFVDIGAGTTSACLVQGYFPTGEDQLSIAFAGDKVDVLLSEAIDRSYPDMGLSLIRVRQIKEQYSYVGKPDNPIVVNLVVGGKMRKLDLGEAIGRACEQLLQRVLDAVKTLIAQASTDSVTELMQNIILTGGGSRIRHLDVELQRLLVEEGFEKPRVLVVGERYKELVAKGALVAARQAKENQWQALPR